MNRLLKKAAAFVLAMAMVFGMSSFAMAKEKDYTIYDCDWYDATGIPGQICASWTKEDDTVKVKLKVYYANFNESNLLFSETVSGETHDVSSVIAKKGSSGNYYFSIYPIMKGGGGEDHLLKSKALNIDSDYMKEIKAYAKTIEVPKPQQPAGWYYSPNGWVYSKGNGKVAKNEWVSDKGFKYYAGPQEVILLGWQTIGGYWYYFNPIQTNIPLGALLTNTITPDGYQVNASGQWVENGIPVPSNKLPAAGSVALTINTAAVAGGFAKITGVSSNGCNVVNWAVTPDYSLWSTGTEVSIAVNVTPKAGQQFNNATKFTCKEASHLTSTGTNNARLVVLKYKPKFDLDSPSGAYISNQGVLCWTGVSYAKRYKVSVKWYTYDDNKGEDVSKSKDFYVTEPSFDLYNVDCDIDEISQVKIIAQRDDNKKGSYKDSAALTIDNFQDFIKTNTIGGSLVKSGKKLTLEDEFGDKMTGWQYIGGFWYYFNDKGKSEGPGWFLDPATNLWYYFDANYRMKTGYINDGTANYYLNTGDVPNYPVGAWVPGR